MKMKVLGNTFVICDFHDIIMTVYYVIVWHCGSDYPFTRLYYDFLPTSSFVTGRPHVYQLGDKGTLEKRIQEYFGLFMGS